MVRETYALQRHEGPFQADIVRLDFPNQVTVVVSYHAAPGNCRNWNWAVAKSRASSDHPLLRDYQAYKALVDALNAAYDAHILELEEALRILEITASLDSTYEGLKQLERCHCNPPFLVWTVPMRA